jgi:hypothetical protein
VPELLRLVQVQVRVLEPELVLERVQVQALLRPESLPLQASACWRCYRHWMRLV